MATVAPSTLASSSEKTNGAKLSRLLIEGGTTALRDIFDGFHPPTNLAAILNSNYSILHNLLRRRVLNRSQWDKLFPPGGAAPSSNTFDITLLFLLLTNICGLSPPHSGWHKKPPLSDASLEANLARIKFFRNELYGHVTTVGITEATFAGFWQEIADALVALGFDKAEIARLSAENSGEEAYLDVLFDWIESESELKAMLKKGNTSLTEEIAKLRIVQQEDRKTLHEVKKTVDTFQSKIEKNGEDEVLTKLAVSEFTGDIEYHLKRFQPGTREWIFEEVQNWLDDRSSHHRAMVISGQAGMGKSVIAAVICQRMQDADRLSGSHFCQHNNARYRNPKLMLQSLAFHLGCALPKYKEALVKQLSRNLGTDLNNMGVEDLFALLFKEPLALVPEPGRNILIVIDGLDESEYQGRNELLDVLAVQFCKLPLWIRILVTTRPGKNITARLKSLKPLELKSDDERNFKDIRFFFEKKICCKVKPEDKATIFSKLVEKSEGLMLYAYFAAEFIENNVSLLDKEQLEKSVPVGISSIYQSYFKRLESEFQKELSIDEDHFLQFLCATVDARSPLPVVFIFDILGLSSESLADQRKLKKCIDCISTLFPIRENHLHMFHKSVKDWLTNKLCYEEHQFNIQEGVGHKILSRLCARELDSIKSKSIHCTLESDTEKYALQHGVQHMLHGVDQGNQLDEIVESYITDPELLYARLCLEDTNFVDDILCVLSQASYNGLGKESQNTLHALLLSFKKSGKILRENPRVIFQTLLNEDRPKLSSRVAAILEAKYPKMPLLEVVDKKVDQGPVQARFDCSDAVMCFDVSQSLDRMVCECRDGTIHLWSIQSGKREWMRSLLWKKNFDGVPHESALRRIHTGNPDCELTWSFYRSVVFHPNGEFVLPGDLTNVYTLNGDRKTLFPNSRCRFQVCSFSGDKTRLLTDCPYNEKEIVLWDMETGEEIRRLQWNRNILSFVLSQSGIVAAISDSEGFINLVNLQTLLYESRAFIKSEDEMKEERTHGFCGLMRFKSNDEALVCGRVLCNINDEVCLESNRSNPVFLLHQSQFAAVHLEQDSYLWPLGESSCNGTELETRDCCINIVTPNGYTKFHTGFCYMINGESALVGSPVTSHVKMLNVTLLNRIRQNDELPIPKEIAFSVDGSIVYAVMFCHEPFRKENKHEHLTTVTGWKIRLPNLGLQNTICHRFLTHTKEDFCSIMGSRLCIPLQEGILLFQMGSKTIELWNNDFSKCLLPIINEIEMIIPISEELVGCLIDRNDFVEVHVLCNKKNGEMVLERVLNLPFRKQDILRASVACSTQCQIVLLTMNLSLISFIGESQVWVREGCLELTSLVDLLYGCCRYSRTEEYIAVSFCRCLEIIDAKTGEGVHTLFRGAALITGCSFLCDSDSLICLTTDGVLRMFDVKSGDLLTIMDLGEDGPVLLEASPVEPLIAVAFQNNKVKLIRAKLPGLKNRRKANAASDPSGKDDERNVQLEVETRQNETTSQSWCTLY